MRCVRLLDACVFVLLVSSFALAGQGGSTSITVTAQGDPQSLAWLQKALSALTGGIAINDVTLTGNGQWISGSHSDSGSSTFIAMAPAYSKMLINLATGAIIETRNPDTGSGPSGIWSQGDGIPHPVANHNLLTDATWFFPALSLTKLSSSNYTWTYAGLTPHNGQQALQLIVAQQYFLNISVQPPIATVPMIRRLSQMNLFLDPATSLPAALDFNSHPDNAAEVNVPTEIRFSQYSTVNGVQLPFHVQRYVNNNLQVDMRVESATLNSGLSITAFQF
jgi:hypothetical protein